MIILTSSTDILQVQLGAAVQANQSKIFANYRTINDTTYTPGRTTATTNGVTAVNVVTGVDSNQVAIDFITLINVDTNSISVKILFNDNGTARIIFFCTLAPNETLQYTDDYGFYVLASTGGVKTYALRSDTFLIGSVYNHVLTNTFTNACPTGDIPAVIPGFSPPLGGAGTYAIKIFIPFNSTTTGNGIRFNFGGIAGDMRSIIQWAFTTTSATYSSGSNQALPTSSAATVALTSGNMYFGCLSATIVDPHPLTIRIASEGAGPGASVAAVAGAVAFLQKVA